MPTPGKEPKLITRHYAAASLFALLILGSAAIGAAVDKSSAPAPADAPLTRSQVLQQGPPALEKNCTGCHLSDKWEGTNRDHDGWAATVSEMSKMRDDAGMPRMNEKTFNLIVDYLTLTHPQ